MTPVSEAVERVRKWAFYEFTPPDAVAVSSPLVTFTAGDLRATLSEIARLTEQVRVAREGLERAAYPGPDELLSPCFIARETIVQMERIDGKDEDYTQTPKAPNSKTGQRQVSAQSKVGADGISSLKETTIPHGEE
jgi:hypothetical protein